MEAAAKLAQRRQAFAIVWTHLPYVTLFCPCIGHTGVATSQGETHDFAGSYCISVGRLTFGAPVKYVPLQLSHDEAEAFDKAIQEVDDVFHEREHSLLGNNCHHHVAAVLTTAGYHDQLWSACGVWWLLLRRGKFLSRGGCLKTYGLLCCLIALLGLFALFVLY